MNRIQNKTKYTKSKRYTTSNPGFTLIETLVAISILVMAVAAPLTLASRSLFVATYAKDQQTAYYLAQEAIEIVRNKRDGNQLAFLKDNTTTWLNGIPISTPFLVDPSKGNQNEIIAGCTTMIACMNKKLQFDGNFYTYIAGGTNSRFGRAVEVMVNPSVPHGATITAMVQWKTGSFKARTIKLEEQIYNWLPGQN